MKTPKEKAKEMVERFTKHVHECSNSEARQCALIAVEEILEALTISTGHLIINELDEKELIKDFNFWQEVKTEIEKL